ncbi:peptidylprolyl isomerase [Carboxylicivirga taeanensis]|uniref:peptidylprolyl isomerase n=1 Tax=Carboxylicivirga taeanensis TaxID=1416875 RepID=UPI003F6E2D18
MKQLISSLFLLGFMMQLVSAQKTPFLTIGDKQFTLEEFNYIYEKNNALTQQPVSKSEYIDLFVNYKLKVEEAIALGYDTLPSFQKELNYYRDELAKPYLNDKKAIDEVVTEAYEHMCQEVDASHILITLPPSPSPADTLKAYTKIAKVKQLLDEGADFKEMVRTYSEGPSAQQSNGRLGYFTAFMMVYPFEKAAYETPVGEVSGITRSAFGYHLIKIHDKRKNRGEVLVAHIMKAFPYNASELIQNQSKLAIDSIYQKLMNGESFSSLVAQYSDDKQTASNGGKLPWFGVGRMVPEFSEAAFALSENGQLSKPVKTPFGYHIIKRLDSRLVKPLDECRSEIMQKIRNDERAIAGKKATVKRLKAEYQFKTEHPGFEQLKRFVLSNSQNDKNKWIEKLKTTNWLIASYDSGKIVSADFAKEAARFNTPEAGISEAVFQKMWTSYADNHLIEVEKANLESKYLDFKYLMNEYHDGLLIFEISQNEVWNKASSDSTGLVNFYEKNKANYILDEHFDGRIFYCKTKAAYKHLKKRLKRETLLHEDSLDQSIRKELLIKQGPFFRGDEAMLDKQLWKDKAAKTESAYPFLLIDGQLVLKQVQPLENIKGRVIADYQEELEQKWVERLRAKYKPRVDTFVFE